MKNTFDRKNSNDNLISCYSTNNTNTCTSPKNTSPKYESNGNINQFTKDYNTINSNLYTRKTKFETLSDKKNNSAIADFTYSNVKSRSNSKKNLKLIPDALNTSYSKQNPTFLNTNTSKNKNKHTSLLSGKHSHIKNNISTISDLISKGKVGFLDKNSNNKIKNNVSNYGITLNSNKSTTARSKSKDYQKNNYHNRKSLNFSELGNKSFINNNSEVNNTSNDITLFSNNRLSSPDTTLHSVLYGYSVEENLDKQINSLRQKSRKSQLEIKVDYCAKQISNVYSPSKNCVNKPVVNINSPSMKFSHKDYLNFSPTRRQKESFIQCNLLRKVVNKKNYKFNNMLEKVISAKK